MAVGYDMFGATSSSFDPTKGLGSTPISFGLQQGASYDSSAYFGFNYSYFSYPATNDVWALAIDFTAGLIWIAQNNVWVNSSNPATGSLPIAHFVAGRTVGSLFPALTFYQTGESWTLQSTAASQKYAPPSGFAAWDGGVAPPPTSVWSSSDASANAMTLSNGGLTITSGAAVNTSIRGTVSQTTGKVYVEFSVVQAGSGNDMFGVASAGFNSGGKLGASTYSGGVGYLQVLVSSGFTAGISNSKYPVNGDTWAVAVDFTAGKVWVAQNNVWLTSSFERDPASGATPALSFTPATVGALFPTLTVEQAGNVYSLQSTAASQKYLPPPGFQAWDGGSVTPTTSVWSASDAAAGGMMLSNGGLTMTPTSTASYKTIRGTIGQTAGKLYVEFLVTTASSDPPMFGVGSAGMAISSFLGNSNYSVGLISGGTFVTGFTSNYALGGFTIAINDVVGLAVDFSAGSVWISKNNVWVNSSNPATASLPVASFVPATVGALFPGLSPEAPAAGSWTLQSTAASQKYAPPSGFSAWG